MSSAHRWGLVCRKQLLPQKLLQQPGLCPARALCQHGIAALAKGDPPEQAPCELRGSCSSFLSPLLLVIGVGMGLGLQQGQSEDGV